MRGKKGTKTKRGGRKLADFTFLPSLYQSTCWTLLLARKVKEKGVVFTKGRPRGRGTWGPAKRHLKMDNNNKKCFLPFISFGYTCKSIVGSCIWSGSNCCGFLGPGAPSAMDLALLHPPTIFSSHLFVLLHICKTGNIRSTFRYIYIYGKKILEKCTACSISIN